MSRPPNRGQARPRDADRGSAVIWALCLIAVVTAATVVAVGYGGAVALRHQADGAADLAALAAAGAAASGAIDACREAAGIAAANGAQLTECLVRTPSSAPGADVAAAQVEATVEVTVRGRGRLGQRLVATGRARAGTSSELDVAD